MDRVDICVAPNSSRNLCVSVRRLEDTLFIWFDSENRCYRSCLVDELAPTYEPCVALVDKVSMRIYFAMDSFITKWGLFDMVLWDDSSVKDFFKGGFHG